MTSSTVYNEDCIYGIADLVDDDSIDMVFTDPPYGIDGAYLDDHYNRKSDNVVGGYIDVPTEAYGEFSLAWITECERALKPGGSIYIVSGYTNLHHILNALHFTNLKEVNHLIVPYSFGVYTSNKYVSSHYHMLYWYKPGGHRTFNTNARFIDKQQSYLDHQSIQPLTRHYKRGEIKYQNQLPVDFIMKYVLYSTIEGDTIMDPFAGSFSTRDAAFALNRNFIGFELNKQAYDTFGHLPANLTEVLE